MATKAQLWLSVVIAGLIAPGAASAAVVDSISVGASSATLGTTQGTVVAAFGSMHSQCIPVAPSPGGYTGPAAIHCHTPSLDADFINDAAVILRTTDRDATVSGVHIGMTERALRRKVGGLRCRTTKLPHWSQHKLIDRACAVGPSERNVPGAYPLLAGQVNNVYFLTKNRAHPKRFKVTGFQLVKRSW